ncbi:MAG TPA: hypothetical protein VMD58_01895 [Acidobacteriaceae bacterium]|nr:hypothetical protein [Acidobacteriaceae bacterium]
MDQTQLHAFQGLMAIAPFFILTIAVLVIIPYWMIWKKAGFSPWLSLLMLIPLINFIMLYVLAFSQWRVVPASQSVTNFTYQNPPSPPQF